jgi:hypothetical protein
LKIAPLAVALALLLGFVLPKSLQSGFFPDDLLNLYEYWVLFWPEVIRQIAWPLADGYRPFGALFYKPLFAAFGLNPLPFRVVCVGLLVLNLTLAYSLFRLLFDEVTAAVSVMLFAFHAYLSDLYYSSATIYDLLGFFFYYLALWLYLRYRRTGGRFQCGLIFLVFVCGLNTKEIVVTLPLIFLVVERLSPAPRSYALAAVTSAVAAVFTLAKAAGNTTLGLNPAYQPSPAYFLSNLERYFGMLVYVHEGLPLPLVFGLIGGAVLVAWLSSSRSAWLALLISLLAPLPVMFIMPRSFYVFYIALWGWAALAGCALVGVYRKLSGGRALNPVVAALFCAAIVVSLHLRARPYGDAWLANEEGKVARVLEQVRRTFPEMPRGAKIFVSDDPLDPDDWFLTFLFRLQYCDETIDVYRAKRGDDPAGEYQYVISLANWKLRCQRCG